MLAQSCETQWAALNHERLSRALFNKTLITIITIKGWGVMDDDTFTRRVRAHWNREHDEALNRVRMEDLEAENKELRELLGWLVECIGFSAINVPQDKIGEWDEKTKRIKEVLGE